MTGTRWYLFIESNLFLSQGVEKAPKKPRKYLLFPLQKYSPFAGHQQSKTARG